MIQVDTDSSAQAEYYFNVKLKPRLQEQFLCDKLYLTIFICWGKPRPYEQFLFENKRLETVDVSYA